MQNKKHEQLTTLAASLAEGIADMQASLMLMSNHLAILQNQLANVEEMPVPIPTPVLGDFENISVPVEQSAE